MNERLNWRKKYGLFDFDAEYIMWNAFLDESQVGIKIAGRNMNSLIYADDTTLMAGSKVELKSLLMKVKEMGEKADLKLNMQKTKIIPLSSPSPPAPNPSETVNKYRVQSRIKPWIGEKW